MVYHDHTRLTHFKLQSTLQPRPACGSMAFAAAATVALYDEIITVETAKVKAARLLETFEKVVCYPHDNVVAGEVQLTFCAMIVEEDDTFGDVIHIEAQRGVDGAVVVGIRYVRCSSDRPNNS